jgi:hypothetical protein
MSSQQDAAPPGPFELIESARTKYTLALARVRRGPPELALLSLHGSLEDALRAYAMRLGLPEVYEPFPQLLDAMTATPALPLSSAEAEGIRRMHRLRARVAHGEQITVTGETIAAYHKLAARLLQRYGVTVVAPEEREEAPAPAATATTVPGRRGETTAIVQRDTPDTRQRGDTAALDRNLVPAGPRRERTVYPDDRPARYAGRMLPSAATRDLPLAREMLTARRSGWDSRAAEYWERSQRWLLPTIIVVSMFLVGLVISASLGQMRVQPVAPTAAIEATPVAALPVAPVQAPSPAAALPAEPVPGGATLDGTAAGLPPTADPLAVASPAPSGGLAVGATAFVRADAVALNVRALPGPDSPIQSVLTPGTAVEIIGGPTTLDGVAWWQVRAAGVEGWCSGEWLEVR